MNTAIQNKVEALLLEFWSKKYQEYQNGEETPTTFLTDFQIDRASVVPSAVSESIDYYYAQIEQRDIGVVRLFQLSLEAINVFLVRTTTDGDDGWIELYDANGQWLGTGRTYIELIAWGETATTRAQTETGEYPTALDLSATLWK